MDHAAVMLCDALGLSSPGFKKFSIFNKMNGSVRKSIGD